VSPSKIYVSSLSAPVQIKFNCSINAYPESNIVWLRNSRNLKKKFRSSSLASGDNRWYQVLNYRDGKAITNVRRRKMRKSNHQNNNGTLNHRQIIQRSQPHIRAHQQHPNLIDNRHSKTKEINNQVDHIGKEIDDNDSDNDIDNENELFNDDNSVPKYSITTPIKNDKFKMSTIMINIESPKDYGIYECLARNRAGSTSVKFYIYGGLLASSFI
jgi:hypothetical protein